MPDLLERLKSALEDRYAVEAEIGRGGMAVVFLAEDLKHHRQVALKVLHPELTATLGAERFLQEIEIVAGLQHPHILPLYDSGEAEGLLYYVMPYAEGESLRQRLDREKQLAVDESVRITVEVADGLDYAHRQGVVHRDIKPGNILLAEGHATIADFGIARAVEAARQERITRTGLGVGTPLYASPEQATAQETLDGRTDIYSLGCVLYEMLAGQPPLTGSTPQMIQARRVSETPSPLHGLRDTVPPALDHVIARALARIPADRYATASQFGQALQAALFATTPPMQALPVRVQGWSNRFGSAWLLRAGIAVLLLSAVALAGAWLSRGHLAVDQVASETPPAEYSETQLTHDGNADLPAISPDGRYLAFAIPDAGGSAHRIVLRELAGAQPDRTLAVVEGLRHLDWHPDGSSLVFRGVYHGESGYYSVPRTGGVLSPVSGRGVFSRDGSESLDWESDGHQLVVLSSDSAGADALDHPLRLDSILIAGEYSGIIDAEYSPDGSYLAVATRSGTGVGDILIVDRDGDDQRILAHAAAFWYSLRWRPNGLFYVRSLSYGRNAIMRLTPADKQMQQPVMVLEVGPGSHRGSYVTADGDQLIVPRRITEQRLVHVREAESDSLSITPIPGSEGASNFWISPDGSSLVFSRKGSLGDDIFILPILGGQPEQLTTSGTVMGFDWSPDGRLLAIAAGDGRTYDVFFVSATGGLPVPLAKTQTRGGSGQVPPGHRLPLAGARTLGNLYWGQGPLRYQLPNGSYWVADSLAIRIDSLFLPLTAENLDRPGGVVEAIGRPLAPNDSLGPIQFPLIASPDGQWIAARWARPDDPGVWKFSMSDSTQVLVVADTRSRKLKPGGWTPDGESIVCYQESSIELDPQYGEDAMFLVSAQGGEPKPVLVPPRGNRLACDPHFGEGDLAFVCIEVVRSSSDAWLIENFDPHVN